MIARSLGTRRVDQALRVARALGAHRYVAGRAHYIHAFAFAAAALDEGAGELAAGRAWARGVLDDRRIDPASRDDGLWRRSTDGELVLVLAAFWGDPAAARDRLRALLAAHDLSPAETTPFDESAEGEIHPLLIDAGWELLGLRELDGERHKGAIGAFGSALAFEVACFEEETTLPPRLPLYELPALGPAELLRGVGDDGALVAPLVVWADGHEAYIDYVLRGVRRAAGLPERDVEPDAEEDADDETGGAGRSADPSGLR
jgi:hypothetical protein